jgi:hypothetical protein
MPCKLSHITLNLFPNLIWLLHIQKAKEELVICIILFITVKPSPSQSWNLQSLDLLLKICQNASNFPVFQFSSMIMSSVNRIAAICKIKIFRTSMGLSPTFEKNISIWSRYQLFSLIFLCDIYVRKVQRQCLQTRNDHHLSKFFVKQFMFFASYSAETKDEFCLSRHNRVTKYEYVLSVCFEDITYIGGRGMYIKIYADYDNYLLCDLFNGMTYQVCYQKVSPSHSEEKCP